MNRRHLLYCFQPLTGGVYEVKNVGRVSAQQPESSSSPKGSGKAKTGHSLTLPVQGVKTSPRSVHQRHLLSEAQESSCKTTEPILTQNGTSAELISSVKREEKWTREADDQTEETAGIQHNKGKLYHKSTAQRSYNMLPICTEKNFIPPP